MRWRPGAAWPRGLADAAGVLGMVIVGLHSFTEYYGGWDTLAYHLPFAALRTGILTPDQFVLPPSLADRLAGFPPLADWVQGGLWLLFGRPDAAALIAPIAVVVFAAYGRAAFGISMLWSCLIFVAVPILHTALDGMYVDLWTNAFFAIHLLAAYRALTVRTGAARHAALSMVALGIAVWSKPQYMAVGALSLALVVALMLLRHWRRSGEPAWRAVAVCVVLSPLAFAWPLRSLALFGNPAWPVALTLGPITLPGTQTNVWDGPAHLAGAPNVERYLLSQLDLDAVGDRPDGYMIDQGSVAVGSAGFRMGGSLSVLLLASLATLAFALARARPRGEAAAAAVGFVILTAVIANLPGANELRYFSFVEIVVLFAALCVPQAQAAAGDAYAAGLFAAQRALLVSAAVYTTCITSGAHVLTHRTPTLRELARFDAEQDGLAAALGRSRAICYVGNFPRGLLYTKLLAPDPPGGADRVVEALTQAGCPPGYPMIGPDAPPPAAMK